MTWLNTLLSPNGFLFHLAGIIALTVLLAVGTTGIPADTLWGALLTLLGITVGTGTQVLVSSPSKTEPPAA
jgi:hypothetical protein